MMHSASQAQRLPPCSPRSSQQLGLGQPHDCSSFMDQQSRLAVSTKHQTGGRTLRCTVYYTLCSHHL